jgi:signal transduction histidine kinase
METQVRPGMDLNRALTEYRLRTVRIGVLATYFVLIALLAYVIHPGQDDVQVLPSLITMGIGLIGAIAIGLLPWRRLFERGLGMSFMYAWSVLDILLVTLLISFAGDSHMEVFFLYAFTTLFFAASYPIRGQLALLAFTFACYLFVMQLQGWPIETPDLVARLGLLLVLMYMSSFLARELQSGMRSSVEAQVETDRRAQLLAAVGRAAKNLSSLDSARVLEAVVGAAAGLGFEAAHLSLFDDRAEGYTVEHAIGLPETYVQQTYPISTGMSGLAHERRETVVLEDYAGHPRAVPVLVRAGFVAGIATPVWVGGILAATLVAWSRVPRAITAPDIEAFELLASLAGRAMENARLFEAERDSAQRLAELDRMKGDFISNVSHELRTPLTAIEGIGVTLERHWETLDEKVLREFLGHLNANATSLHQIITTLLDFSRIEAGRLDLDIQDIRVHAWLDSLLGRLRHITKSHTVSLLASESVVVRADPVLMDRVVENLVSNAIKHTPEGTRVTLTATSVDGRATISVSDDGPGIPEAELPHLGDRFFRGGDPQTRNTRGTGLGLAFVREILRLHGTELEIESAAGRGSRFWFELPVSRSLSESA